MPIYRVHRKDLQKGTTVEMKEHPTMAEVTARRTARQHLQHHPMYYQVEPQFEKMLDRREKGIKPIRHHPRPAQRSDPYF